VSTASAPPAGGVCPVGDGVQPANIVRFDTHDPAIAADPFPTYAMMRRQCPVVWSENWGGFWVATGHPEVARAGRDTTLHSGYELADGTVQGISIPSLGQTDRLIPLELNAPQAQKYRKLISSFYSPKQVQARRAEILELTTESIDEIIENGSGDIVDAVTERVSSILAMRDIGIAEHRWREMDAEVQKALVNQTHDLAAAQQASQLICLHLLEEIEARRDGQQGGLVGDLIHATIDGQPLSDEDITAMMYLLLLGIHPTSTLLSTSLWYLARHPRLKATLVADKTLIPQATEEFLRWVSPVQATSRTATTDTTIAGHHIRAGERVLLSWAGANRDERLYSDADHIDLSRDTGAHLAFGSGMHYCTGASIVRAIFAVVLEQVLTRMPDYRLSDEDAIEWFPDLSSVFGITRLPITFTPGPRLSRRPTMIGVSG